MASARGRTETARIAEENRMPAAALSDRSLIAIAPREQRSDRGAEERFRAPGWFDSSWDLRRGLEVHEGWLGDEELNGWIEGFLRHQRTCGRTASPSASTAIA
jgi:hypothetical protein